MPLNEPDDGALATIEKAVAETGTALKSISDRLEKADKSVNDHDGQLKTVKQICDQAVKDIADAKKSVDSFMDETRKALKAIPSSVYSGGHDRAPEPWNTRGDGSGFIFSDRRAAKAFGLWVMTGCAPHESTREAAMKALDDHCKKGWGIWFKDAVEHLERVKTKALGSNVFSGAGALVPEAFIADLIRNVEMHGKFAVNAFRLPMTGPTVTIPKHLTELTVYYPEENGEITESQPTVGDLTFTARLYATLTKWSNTLDEDSAIDFGAYIAELITWAHTYAIDLNGFRGDGSSTYARTVGAMNAPNIVSHILGNAVGASATNTGKDTFGELAYADLNAAQALLPTDARPNAKWYMHRYVAGICQGLVDTTGKPIVREDVVNGQRVMRLLGDPIVETDVMPSTTAVTTPFILYGDLRKGMAYGERRALRIDNSKEAGFSADQTWVRSTARRAIGPIDGTRMVKLVTSTT